MRTRVGLMHSTLAVSGNADDVAQARSRFGPAENRAPSALGVSGILGRPADVAILLVGLTRYTAGLQIELAVRCRLDPHLEDRMHPTFGAGLSSGVEIADGRTAAVAGRHIRNNWPAADPTELTQLGGGGREWSSTLWSTPAPPPEDPVLTVADPASAWTSRVSPWMPKHFERRPRRLRSCSRARLTRRIRPLSRRSTYHPAAIAHGYFRR
ncbi:hypothetical protein ASD16_12005 [Cellulomonas sp. Root485]|nr:hypothetical protein ASD16_12005 [Cellulomonas sp. Root485]